MAEIVLPPKTEHVTVETIPSLLALAIHPEPPLGRVVSYLTKHAGSAAAGIPLPEDNKERLCWLWFCEPHMWSGVHESEWAEWASAFDCALGRPSWTPVPVWRNDSLNAGILRFAAENEHRVALSAAIARNELVPLSHAHIPTGNYPDAIVTLDAFRAYAARFGVCVRVSPSHQNIDWEYWQGFTEVRVWQALLLSLGIDPSDDELDLRDLDHHREFRRRRDRLLNALSNRDFFSPATLNMGDPLRGGVSLTEFAAWFVSFNPPMGDAPHELLDIGTLAATERQTKKRRAEGRYTLEEASESVERDGGERGADVLRKLVAAVNEGTLAVYAPGRYARYDYGDKAASRVRAYYEEAYWNDLNAWLDTSEPRIRYRFPNPIAPTAGPDSSAVRAETHERPDPERRLAALRALGGQAKWKRQGWRFTGIAKLVEQESGRARNTEKTIRADLREAAEAERDANRSAPAQLADVQWPR